MDAQKKQVHEDQRAEQPNWFDQYAAHTESKKDGGKLCYGTHNKKLPNLFRKSAGIVLQWNHSNLLVSVREVLFTY